MFGITDSVLKLHQQLGFKPPIDEHPFLKLSEDESDLMDYKARKAVKRLDKWLEETSNAR